jgi:hypothetical protein
MTCTGRQEGGECGRVLLECTPPGIKAGLSQTVRSTKGPETEAALLPEAQPAPPLLFLAVNGTFLIIIILYLKTAKSKRIEEAGL